MADDAAIAALSRQVSGLVSELKMATNLKEQLVGSISPTGSGSSGNILANSLASFSSASGSSGIIGQIVGGAATIGLGQFVGNMQMLPDIASTINRSQGFYQAALGTGGALNKTTIGNATFSAMRGGITSPGSDAMVGRGLASMGVMASTNPSSAYMQMVRNVKNSAMYLGQDNATAMQAVAGLTTGDMSGNLAATMGIYTSDLNGNTRSESDIFNNIYSQLTAGSGKITAKDVNDSFYKGNLGADLTNLGFSDAQKQRFLQFAINKAGGTTMDLSNNSVAAKLMGKNNKLGNSNPIQSTLNINTTMTGQMNAAAPSYEKGMADAATQFQAMNAEVLHLIGSFGELNAKLQTFLGTPSGQGQMTKVSSAVTGAMQIGSGLTNILLGLVKGGPSSGNALGAVTPGDKYGPISGPKAHVPANGPITATLHEMGPMWGPHGHNGTDYGVADGSAVYAAAAGVVRKDAVSQAADGGYGHYVTIDHGNGYSTLYAHLDPASADVHEGDTVKAGQVIGRSGHSGHVTGPHLHFEVRKDGQSVPIESFLAGAVETNPPQGNSTSSASAKSAKSGLNFSFGMAMASLGQSVNDLLGISAPQTSTSVASWSGPGTAQSQGISVKAASGKSAGMGNPSGGTYSGISLGSTTPVMGSTASAGPAKVEINLHIAQASADEARKFAALVKGVLEGDHLAANMGAY